MPETFEEKVERLACILRMEREIKILKERLTELEEDLEYRKSSAGKETEREGG